MRLRDLATLVTVLLVVMATIMFARWDINEQNRRTRLLLMTTTDTLDLVGRHCFVGNGMAGIRTQDGKDVRLSFADGTAVCVRAAR